MQSGELINGKTLTPRMSDRTKSFVELEKKTRESAKNRWMNTLGLNDLDRDDGFQFILIPSLRMIHTNYFAPEEKNVLMLASVVN
jgi:hypothetical protein